MGDIFIIVSCLIILGIFMGRKHHKHKVHIDYRQKQRDKISSYCHNFKINCEGKTLREIIDDYCEIMNEQKLPNYYKGLFTNVELDNILFP